MHGEEAGDVEKGVDGEHGRQQRDALVARNEGVDVLRVRVASELLREVDGVPGDNKEHRHRAQPVEELRRRLALQRRQKFLQP